MANPQALADVDPKKPDQTPAAAAAAWLRNPHAVEKRSALAQLIAEIEAELAAQPEWTGTLEELERLEEEGQ